MGYLMRICLLLVAVLGANAATTKPTTTRTTTTTTKPTTTNTTTAANGVTQYVPLVDTRIVGGVAVAITGYPYQLSMRINGNHICGASIISTLWAVTAAHCSGSVVTSMTLRAGTADRTVGGTIHQVIQKIIHTSYSSSTQDYDIALLKVATPFVYTASVKNIALPAQGAAVATGLVSSVSGWGTLSSGATTLPTKLMAVSVPVVAQTACQSSYGVSKITPRMICAGYTVGGKDTCQGDSGGPMVATLGGVKQLVGVTSWGYGCAQANYPGVYARVPDLRTWIKTNSGV